MAFEIKRNDRRPRWRVQLTANGVAVNLSAVGVTAAFTMTSVDTPGTPKVARKAMTLVDAATGVVEYPWALGDTDIAGEYNVEVEVDWGGGETQTFPSSGYFTLRIEEDLV